MAKKRLAISSSSFIKHEVEFVPHEVKSFPEKELSERPQLVDNSPTVGLGANQNEGQREISNTQSRNVTVYRKIKLIHSPTDPLTNAMKQRIERAVRVNFCTRVAMHLREYAAFRTQKLVIELLPSDKVTLTTEEQTKKVLELTKSNIELLKDIETRDENLGLPEKLKTIAWQCWMYGRNALLILYDSENNQKINTLFQINSRRMGEPILNEEEDLKFEGCEIDGSALDKDSMIYAVYQDRELSPHTEKYGYGIMELILVEAETHNYMIQNTKEVALSAFLPTILLKVDTETMTNVTDKTTKINTVMNQIEPGKIIGVTNDVEEATMLDMKPDYKGYVEMMDSQEVKIYNAFHVPLFLVKSDEIANRSTANKSTKLFLDGVVTDDQIWMQETLGKQWYDPLLREKLAESIKKPNEKTVDTSDPVDSEQPLPFLIRRKFELPTVEDFIDLADALVSLKTNNIWDTQKTNEILKTEDVTSRVLVEEKENKELDNQRLIAEVNSINAKSKTEQKVATASKSTHAKKSEILDLIRQKVEQI